MTKKIQTQSKAKMDSGGAYGGGKAGAPFDVIAFVQRPQVILRGLCLLFAIIVFGCISSQGYFYDKELKREVCLYNDDNNACNYGESIGVIAFLASIGFLAGEYLFEQMSSVKTRKHYVLGDLGFSGLWSFLYFVGFCYLANRWGAAKQPEGGYGENNMRAAIAFSFFSIFTWAGCAWLAYQRFRQGTESAFAPSYDAEGGASGGANAYGSYPVGGGEMDAGSYHDPPFSSGVGNQQMHGNFQPPAY